MEKTYNFKKTEKKIKKFWRDIELLKLLQKKNSKGKPYFLLDGPPYANDKPHVGHIRNTVYKDFYIRWAFMKGYDVLFQPGFDTHGLPIENKVEKKLKLKSKNDIEKYGISKFASLCKDHATNYKNLWLETYDALGSWYSWKNPYITYENEYIESSWWAFKKLWDKGMVYEGKKPVFWCHKCQTALAGYETSDSYKNVTDPSIYVKFKVKNTKEDYLLVYTTTPWTLPANVVICVSGKDDYVKVKTDKGNLILAKQRLSVLDELSINYSILETFKGKKLDGMMYESILDVPIQKELSKNPKALKVYLSIPILKERVASKVSVKKKVKTGDVFEDFVTVNDGSGLVHSAPGHGKTDHEIGKHYGLPNLSPLDDACKFTDDVGQFQGEFVKDADHAILDVLHKTDRLLNYSKIEHNYPLCWRCKAPLIFRMSNQWFLKVNTIKEDMLSSNYEVNWQPDFAKDRFTDWVANAEDWNFSRQRYWGIPVPIWKCGCGDIKVIGSVKELKKYSTKSLPKNFDLHTTNNISLNCSCGKKMKRINDIFDVWFDSGCAPFAAFHYPFKNKNLFESHYPVNRINEAQDQVRGWFYSLMFIGIGVFGKAPYKTVSMPGWVLDANGDKMSKSLGNVVWAKNGLSSYGADALRFYYLWDIDPSSTQKFNIKHSFMEVSKFFNILWNLHNFVLDQTKKITKSKYSKIEDKWIRSRFNSVLKSVLKDYDAFKLHNGTRTLYNFLIDDLSRSYVQMIRNRLHEDKEPLSVINEILLKVVKVLASVAPFISEQVYQNMKGLNKLEKSVHMERLPSMGKSDLKLEKSMALAQEVIVAGLACRDRASIGVRWPLSTLLIDSKSKMKPLELLIKNTLNIKSIKYGKADFDIKIKPNFKVLGKEFGQETAEVAELINKNMTKICTSLKKSEKIKIGKFELTKKYFNIKKISPSGFMLSEFKNGQVSLSIDQDDDLLNEGFARELIRRIQQLRKDVNLKKADIVKVFIVGDLNDKIKSLLESFQYKIGVSKLLFEEKKFKDTISFNVKNKKFKIGLKK